MDINFILFLIAVLNLTADLYNVYRFREHLPRWMLWANVSALAACATAWTISREDSGYICLGILAAYIISIKRFTRRRTASPQLPSLATKLLIGMNIAAFLVQVSRGATDDMSGFVELGAVFSPLLEEGEWWRIFTAQFLHWGVMHLAFNMLGLWILGPTVEAVLGFWRYIALYLLCGAGGMLIAWGFASLAPEPHPIVLLGASASVLGLVGTQAAMSLLAYRYTGSVVAKAQLSAMTQIVLLQAVFDMMVPQVSSTAHVGGAAVGFCVSYGFMRRRWRLATLSQEDASNLV